MLITYKDVIPITYYFISSHFWLMLCGHFLIFLYLFAEFLYPFAEFLRNCASKYGISVNDIFTGLNQVWWSSVLSLLVKLTVLVELTDCAAVCLTLPVSQQVPHYLLWLCLSS